MNAEEKERLGKDFKPKNMPTYSDMPLTYTYDRLSKKRKVRQRGFSVGRIHNVSPTSGDVFYLKMLLNNQHCCRKTSFKDMLTIDETFHESYQSVCRELGLLSDDQEWTLVLTEAAVTKMCPEIRSLYVVILMFCQPSDPKTLFDNL